MTLLNDKYEIEPAQPLPDYDTFAASAFAVRARNANASSPSLIALVAREFLPSRSDLLPTERSLTHPGLMLVKDCGPVLWTPDSIKKMAFIYERPQGRRLAQPDGTGVVTIREDYITDRLIKPLALATQELARLGVFHGGIRADNVYIGEGEGARAQLGEHLIAPPGYGQPVVYETIERGLAPSLARGAGGAMVDLYALGVTILTALLGDTPLRELGEEAIVQLKMERGSYNALVGERRFGNGLTELLRGLLSDDIKQRWSHQDFDMWLEGRRLTPKQSLVAKKASRPLRFNGQEFWQARQLAAAMAHDTKLAAALIKNDEINRWISHGLGDEDGLKYLEEALQTTRRQRAGPEEERLVANTAMTLDPAGPIRYRGVSVFPAGFPVLLADAMRQDTPPTLLIEILQNDMPTLWMGLQAEKGPDLVAAIQMTERAKDSMEKPQLGFGIERALYDTNPTLPCLSPIVRNYYPMTMRHLMDALDKNARQGGPMDRHIAAFILARDRRVLPTVMRVIEQAKDAGMRGVGLLTLFSDLQYRLKIDRLPGLAAALLPLVEESAKRFKNRNRQEKARKDLRVVAAEGDLGAMLKQIDDPNLLALDEQEFTAARMIYQETNNEVTRMEAYARNRKAIAIQAGEPLAAAIAVGLAFLLIVVVIARTLLRT